MDWNDIPDELLGLILSNVLGDRYSISLVCESWNRVAKALRFHHSPCLMSMNQRSSRLWKCFQHNGFFRMNFPTLVKDAVVRFSNDGWLLMMSSNINDQLLFFFNPFSNQTIELPPHPSYRGYTTMCFFNPPTSPDCLIVGIRSITGDDSMCHGVTIGALRYGKERWTMSGLVRDRNHQFKVSFGPPVLHDGKIYFLDFKGNVAVLYTDLSSFIIYSRCFVKRRSRRGIKDRFLIKPKNEETIFGVFVGHDEGKVSVFELTDEFRWNAVHDLGDRVFYVSKTSSMGYKTKDKRMANKIFFPKFHGDKIVYYSMDTQKYHTFDGDYSSNNSYDLRKLDVAPWITPTVHPQGSRELT